jgi:hypothetical protein
MFGENYSTLHARARKSIGSWLWLWLVQIQKSVYVRDSFIPAGMHVACYKMVYPMLGLWMEASSSDFLSRRCSRRGVPVLEFDRVSEDMLPRSDSFNDNGFASGKLLWRSEKLLISDGAASSSGVVVICLPSL